jgi:hypothetical protein
MIDICRLAMSASYDNMVPGESCFNLNFSNPGGSGPAQSLLISSSSSNKTIVASDTIQPQSTMIRTSRKSAHHSGPTVLPNGKKTKGIITLISYMLYVYVFRSCQDKNGIYWQQTTSVYDIQ